MTGNPVASAIRNVLALQLEGNVKKANGSHAVAGSGRQLLFGDRERYHLTTPFCQTSKRSRVLNNSVIAPEHNSDITISAAYMLA